NGNVGVNIPSLLEYASLITLEICDVLAFLVEVQGFNVWFFFFSSRRRHTRSVSAFLLNRSSDLSKKFKIAEGQWYRYAPSYVSPAYHLLEGFPFIQEPPSGDLQERVLIRHHDYDQCFQSVQLLQWNSQVKFNVTV